jgi:glycosyltransferase involved in cell wall biosynthesis
MSSYSMKILHVFPTFGMGGVQARFCQIANHAGQQFQHVIVSLDGDISCSSRLSPELKVSFKTPQRVGSLRSITSHMRLLKETTPDTVVTSNWGSIEIALAARLMGINLIHMEDGFGADPKASTLKRRIFARRVVLSNVPILVPSENLLRIVTQIWGFSNTHINLIPNGVDLNKFYPRTQKTDKGFHIGTVAALRPEKNITRLLRSFAKFVNIANEMPDLYLHLAGDGPDREALTREAVNLGIENRVVFEGYMSDPSGFYRKLDLFMLSSDTEQAPLSVLEAMASGLPVISTAVGDVPHMICDGNLWTVPLEKGRENEIISILAERMMMIFNSDSIRNTIGINNRDKAKSYFNLNTMCDRHTSFWSKE